MLIHVTTQLAQLSQALQLAVAEKQEAARRHEERKRALEGERRREQEMQYRLQAAMDAERQQLDENLESLKARVALNEVEIRNGELRLGFVQAGEREDTAMVKHLRDELESLRVNRAFDEHQLRAIEARIQLLEQEIPRDQQRLAEMEASRDAQCRRLLCHKIDDLERQALEREATGDIVGALAVFESALELAVEKRRELYEARADLCLRNLLLHDAWRDYQEALEGAPPDTELRIAHRFCRMAEIARDANADDAMAAASRAFRIFHRHLGHDHVDTANAAAILANALLRDGRLEEAKEVYQQVQRFFLDKLGMEHEETCTVTNKLGVCANDLGDFNFAETCFDQALHASQAALGLHHHLTIQIGINSVDLYTRKGDLTRAIEAGRGVAAAAAHARGDDGEPLDGGEDNVLVVRALSHLAEALEKSDQLAEAEALERRAWEISTKLMGTDHPESLQIMNGLGLCVEKLGRYAEAEKLLTEALDGRQNRLGPDHTSTLISFNNVAAVYRRSGKLQEAEQKARTAVSGIVKQRGSHDHLTLQFLGTYADSLMSLGKQAEAKRIYRRALESCKMVFGKWHHHTLGIGHGYAHALLECGDFGEAELAVNESFRLHQERYGDNQLAMASAISLRADLLCSQGKYRVALPLLRDVLRRRIAVQGQTHPGVLSAQTHLAECLLFLKKYEEALRHFKSVLEARKDGAEHDQASYAAALGWVAVCLQRAGRKKESAPLTKEAYDLCTKALGHDHPAALRDGTNYSLVLEDEGDYEAAEELLKRSWAGFAALYGRKHPETLQEQYLYGFFLLNRERFAEGITLLEDALTIARQNLPEGHRMRTLLQRELPRARKMAKRKKAVKSLFQKPYAACFGRCPLNRKR